MSSSPAMSQLGDLVGLGVRAQSQVMIAAVAGHASEIALDYVQVNQNGRGIQVANSHKW
jgi:hypothetical protein